MSKINNADRPAKPFQEVTGMVGGIPTGYKNHTGLTKREQFAMAAMQGILANQAMIDNGDRQSIEWVGAKSVMAADALLAELEKSQ